MSQRTHILILALLVLSLGLASCSPGNPTPTPDSTGQPGNLPATQSTSATAAPSPTPGEALTRGTITLWHSWDETQVPALVQAIADFQASYPDVQFDVLYVPVEDLLARYETATSEGSGPTVLLGPADWGPPLYDEGLVADLSSLASQDLLERINPAALGSGEYQGALVSLPESIRGVVIFRNQRIIAEPPSTFENWITLSRTATQGDFIGAVLERSFYYSGAILNGIGGTLMDANGEPAFNDQKGLEWVNLLRSFDQVGPTEFLNDRDLDLFKTGKVGFVIDGTWNMHSLADAIGAQYLTIDPWPSYQNGYLSGYVQSENLYLSARAEQGNRAAAWKFIEYFLSSPVQSKLAESGRIPATTGLEVGDPLTAQAITALAGGTTYPPLPEMSAYTTPMDSALRSVFEDGVAPEDALQTAADTIRTALDELHAAPTSSP